MQDCPHAGGGGNVLIELERVSYRYENQSVLQQLSFTVAQRDFVALVGANGAGKTTMLKLIVGLLKPNDGHIRLFGQPLPTFRDWDYIGYVPQKNQFNPLFPATVEEIVLTGLYSNRYIHRRITRREQQKCHDALEALGVHNLLHKRIGQLSGGQQQRVFLARALINNPRMLILDEPTVGIDARTLHDFFHLIQHMHDHHDLTLLMVTHDLDLVHQFIGTQPAYRHDKLEFYVKHADVTKSCQHGDLTHSLRELRLQSVE
jgi:zinc transport system ATP-binding protein